uniref:Disease resistance protein RPM1 n=1 Tax=Arundo donax TaxID=35708 RepID=A0A0A9DTK9_ARUDO
MEATALSVGKSVLDGALGYAKSAIAEEVALQLGVQRDHAFIRDELEMMQAFLMAAHGERDNHNVLMAWVKQVRDVAYDSEDCLQDFSIHLRKPSWWRFHRTLRERRRIAKQMKELRARVEDVSQRNLRYQLTETSGSKPATAAELSSITAAAIFGIDEACRAAKHDESKEDLVSLIKKEGDDLKVIAVWGTSGDLGQTSIINTAYEDPDIKKKLSCRAWVRVLHPFNPNDFIQSLVKQFRSAMGVDVLLETETTGQELVKEFTGYVTEKTYLIVLNDLSTFEEWNGIKACFPNNKKGSRIIVCAPHVEVASLCAGQESQVLELKQLSADQTIYAFYEKDSWDQTKLPMAMSSSNETISANNSMVPTNEIPGGQSKGSNERNAITKSFTRIKTMASALEESQLIGREKEKSDVVQLVSNQPHQEPPVISVWGMGGLGKTTLVKDVYQTQKLIGMFEKRAFVTVLRPFNLKELLKSLIMQLNAESFEKKGAIDSGHGTKNTIATMGFEALIKELARLLEGKKFFIVLDDLSSTTEWDHIIRSFPKFDNACRIVVTTREESIAKHCSEKQENIYKLKVLEYKDALDLFIKKVFKEATELDRHPELIEEAKLILKKCSGLPLAIVTIGGFLANLPKKAMEWRKLNDHISAELEMNPELGAIRTILGKSYDGLPYHLKSCFLYMSIFPEGHKISRGRLMRRWTAEGYSREFRDKSAEEIADMYFMDLIGRSIILPSQQSIHSRKGIDSCQVHDLMREISISKSTEENLVFRLENGCSLNTQGAVRHLTISSNWEGDQSEFESIVDFSRIRSLTVFGKWRSFFISDKMRLLRVLDLEGTSCLVDHHLQHIGKLLHLKYLSLRHCDDIYQLPDSLGNLKQLQTLDIKGSGIIMLPKTIIKLRKLQYLRGGILDYFSGADPHEVAVQLLPKLCMACCAPRQHIREALYSDGDANRRDLCYFCCFSLLPMLARQGDPCSIVVPKGIRKLKALHTLGSVNIAGGSGKAILQDIKRLTRLRKLEVCGVNKKNCEEFWSTLADLSSLESLTVKSVGSAALHGCLDGVSSPPKNLQSLKLFGNLFKLPEWIKELQNLVKLKLRDTKLSELDATIQVLGKLPNLAILRLWDNSLEGEQLHLNFHQEAFPNLMVLELGMLSNPELVDFKEGATPKLEQLQFYDSPSKTNAGMFRGLAYLQSLKEFILDNDDYKEEFLKDVGGQLAENPNRPILKRG